MSTLHQVVCDECGTTSDLIEKLSPIFGNIESTRFVISPETAAKMVELLG